MSLDLYLATTANHMILGTLEPRLSLADEHLTGILAVVRGFVGPLAAGGPRLDEYGTNVFGPSDLPALGATLRHAAAHVSAGPASFEIWVGTEVIPVEREIYQQVTSEHALSMILAIHEVVEEAIRAGAWLFAVGE